MRKNEDIPNKIYKTIENFLLPLTLDKTYETIIQEGTKLTGAKYGSLYIRRKGTFNRVYTTFPSGKKIAPIRRGYAYQAYKSNKLIIIDKKQAIQHHPEMEKMDINYIAFVPLTHEKGSMGVVAFNFTHKNLSKEQVNALKFFGMLTSLVIKKMKLHEEVKSALKAEEFFISLASHELKTPLTSINVYAQFIKNKISKKENIDLVVVDNLLSSIKRLLQIIEDFLQVNQIKAGKLHFNYRKESIKKILFNVVSDFKTVYPEYKIEFIDRVDNKKEFVDLDIGKFTQALSNLLNNSIKFSKKGSKIILSLELDRRNFLIDIKDQGIGISKKNITKIFEPFFKADNKPGMGLGLFLAKEVIEQHKGTIRVASRLNKGTTFRIILPQKK